MIRIAAALFFWLIFFSPANPALAQRSAADSTAAEKIPPQDSLISPETREIPLAGALNDQELRSYRSDFFPLDFTQRGRLAVNTYKGMPAGLYQFEFAGKRLFDPVSGYWNEQWIPYYQIAQTTYYFGDRHESYRPPAPVSPQPATRVFFSQDYTLGLSLVDINFLQRVSRKNYVQLSGSNFVGDGSEGADNSRFKVNTYRGQLHWQLGEKWSADIFYWHMRHGFNLGPEEPATSSDKFKLIADIAWVKLAGRLSERDSLEIVPGYQAMQDRYTRGSDRQRENRSKLAHLDAAYFHKFSSAAAGIRLSSRWFTNEGKRFWFSRSESDGGARAFFHWQKSGFSFRAEGGAYAHSEAGSGGTASAALEASLGNRLKIGGAAFSAPQAIPLLWRSFNHDSIPAYPGEHLIQRQGASLLLKIHLTPSLWVQGEPFAFRTRDYPFVLQDSLRWEKRTVENRGVRVLAGWNLWRLQLQNDFTYNHHYKEAFAPQISNISVAKISFPMFKNALKLDGVFTWRYVGYFQIIRFNRLLSQYRLTEFETGPFYLSDFRIQAHFRGATVFFIWENLVSEDYFFIQDTFEYLRILRIGVDWTLFD